MFMVPSLGHRPWQPTDCCVTLSVALFRFLQSPVSLLATLSLRKQLTSFQVYNNLTYPWASSLLAFLAVAFALLPWVFYMFGGKVRRTSAYIT